MLQLGRMHCSWTFGGVVMCLTPASLLAASAASPFSSDNAPAGEFVWFDGPVTHDLRNVGTETFEALVVEWLATK